MLSRLSRVGLCSPLDRSLPDSPVHGILQARTLEWIATSYSRGSSQPRDCTSVSTSPALAGRLFITGSPLGSPIPSIYIHRYITTLESISENIKHCKQVVICSPYDLNLICGNRMLFKSKQRNTDHSKFCYPDQSLIFSENGIMIISHLRKHKLPPSSQELKEYRFPQYRRLSSLVHSVWLDIFNHY